MSPSQSLVNTGPSPSARLDLLPNEVLSLIMRHLDPSSSASLAQTCRRVAPLCETGIWRTLDLTAMPRFRTLKAENASLPTRPDPELYFEAVRWMIAEALEAGNRRRWGMVTRVKLCPVAGTQHTLVHLLGLVAGNVKGIHALHAGNSLGSTEGLCNNHATLDLILLDAKLSFPSLTHLRLDRGAVLFPGALSLLCNASPNLVKLEADIHLGRTRPWFQPGVPPFPRLDRDTQLKYICLQYDRWDEDGEMGPDDDEDADAEEINHAMLALIGRSPRLEQLSLQYWRGYMPEFLSDVGDVLAGSQYLRELNWGYHTFHFMTLGELSARVLMFEVEGICVMFGGMPVRPNLEIVHYDVSYHAKQPPPANSSHIPPDRLAALQSAQQMLRSCANMLRSNPRLRYISHRVHNDAESGFDIFTTVTEISRSGSAAGAVSSFIHGDCEVLHLRILLDVCEIGDDEADSLPAVGSLQVQAVVYRTDTGERRNKFYDRLPESVVQYFTDYEGKCVPLEVIEAMRMAERMSEDDWYQRGVQVGEVAWRILTDWSERSA